MEPVFFESAEGFRAWLVEHGSTEPVLWMGYWKKGSGRLALGYREALDEALCFGWIDGQARTIDADRYMQRWTPRRKGSTWSAVNIRRMGELIAAGRANPAGLAAFERRTPGRSAIYSHEQAQVALSAEQETRFRADPAAWAFWERQPASYTKTATWWVVSAKQEPTRERRLERLIAECQAGRRLAQFVSPAKREQP
jgi:uncharacterized protein YdeI (YjbR/CyaY-like superfamily)